MKKKLFAIIALLLFHSLNGQETIQHTWLNYSGTIGPYPVEIKVRLTKNADSVWGEYYYPRKGTAERIYLNGISTAEGTRLQEQYFDYKSRRHWVTGYFILNTIGSKILTGHWEGEQKNRLPVMLTRLESIAINDLQQWDIRLRMYKGEAENAGGSRETYTKANGLKIYDPAKKQIQTLTGFDEVMYDHRGEVEQEDLNFDGYPDLKIPIYFPQAIKNDGSFLYFIYNPQTRMFSLNKELNELGFLDFNAKTKEFRRSDADGRGNEGDAFYRWKDGAFHLIRELRVYENSPYTFYTEYAIKNGRSVKTRSYRK